MVLSRVLPLTLNFYFFCFFFSTFPTVTYVYKTFLIGSSVHIHGGGRGGMCFLLATTGSARDWDLCFDICFLSFFNFLKVSLEYEQNLH